MKVNRHAKIIELINKYHIETQEELADYLTKEGFKVTQATVSRDIRDLKLTKILRKREAALCAASGNREQHEREIYPGAEGWICVHGYGAEHPGDQDRGRNGYGSCGGLDAMKWNEVVGCIAGDDTIMCAIRSVDDTVKVMDKISKIVL